MEQRTRIEVQVRCEQGTCDATALEAGLLDELSRIDGLHPGDVERGHTHGLSGAEVVIIVAVDVVGHALVSAYRDRITAVVRALEQRLCAALRLRVDRLEDGAALHLDGGSREDDLLDRMQGLLESQVAELIFRLSLDAGHVPPGAPVTRALAIIALMKQRGNDWERALRTAIDGIVQR